MRMKDDHMRNGQLKPGYNLQIATNNQFVLAFGVYSYPGDTRTLKPFLKSIHKLYGDIPDLSWQMQVTEVNTTIP
ncbi:hypothetical protein [Staphylococcus pseudintermedius]|nr:hypothetical protein [Staphylococcus pseudintermedius]